MGAFEIQGGKSLSGEITPQGAKNEALQVINAVLLTKEKVIINNIPNIIDVNKLIKTPMPNVAAKPLTKFVPNKNNTKQLRRVVMWPSTIDELAL